MKTGVVFVTFIGMSFFYYGLSGYGISGIKENVLLVRMMWLLGTVGAITVECLAL